MWSISFLSKETTQLPRSVFEPPTFVSEVHCTNHDTTVIRIFIISTPIKYQVSFSCCSDHFFISIKLTLMVPTAQAGLQGL